MDLNALHVFFFNPSIKCNAKLELLLTLRRRSSHVADDADHYWIDPSKFAVRQIF